jgi:predicted ArsR family transcriptional regulator
MPPTDEAQFIALWTEGLSTAAIAQRLDIAPGAARSRAYALQQRGLITAHPEGGGGCGPDPRGATPGRRADGQ